MVAGLDFIAIPSRDSERARAFYVETLGLRPDERARFEVWIGETCFSIWEPERIGWEFQAQKNGHVAIRVEDVATARAELEAKGVGFTGALDTGVCHMALHRPRRQRPHAPPPLRAPRLTAGGSAGPDPGHAVPMGATVSSLRHAPCVG